MTWANDSCVAQRMFGDKDQPFILRFERFGPIPAFQLVISGKQLLGAAPGDSLTVTYGPGGYSHRTNTLRIGSRPDGAPVIFIPISSLVDLPASPDAAAPSSALSPQIEAAVTEMTLRHKGRDIALKTRSLGPVFIEMRRCANDLLTLWGLDPAQQGTLRRPATPKGSPGQWLLPSDYPLEALRAGQQAIIAFRLMVDAEGKPTSCTLQRSYSGKQFEALTCSLLMRRARFTPALDAHDQPVASVFLSQVSWIMQP